jgi:hypothetical protein
MLALNIHARQVVTLPASAFPSRAHVYVCDQCGRDVTKQFRVGQSHAWAPLGPETYVCICGQRYLTGATEWDHLGDHERSRRVGKTLGVGAVISAMFSVLGLAVYLILHFGFGLRQGALLTSLFLAALPFVLMQITFWPEVIVSMWRTRMGKREQTKR